MGAVALHIKRNQDVLSNAVTHHARTYDFTAMYTTLPQDAFIKTVTQAVEKAYEAKRQELCPNAEEQVLLTPQARNGELVFV